MPTYNFKITPELLWTLFLVALSFVLTAFLGVDPRDMEDWGWREWRVFMIGSIIGAGRAVVALIIAAIGMTKRPPEGDINIE